MAYDLVTWSPAVGGSGTDRYDLPAGSYVPAGSSSFSSTPTISEINASSGINQIIGLINRRGRLFVSGYSDLSYATSGERITKSFYDSIKTKIGSLRSAEYFSDGDDGNAVYCKRYFRTPEESWHIWHV